ncbi:hypothetical protein PR202_gb14897 [Eleusine coracana subsp. coracana]|uniref:Expansin-like EG45 domain-containing protein n=1 Tax=Eleusine coracana subsp. coracana TaxID=191504 RepID=A0AAV5EW87_ELECO|nr:hypothetical protein PR202_gb14897 [Eleusine coracana subsp. coracana]
MASSRSLAHVLLCILLLPAPAPPMAAALLFGGGKSTKAGLQDMEWRPATATWYGEADGDGSDGGACGYGTLVDVVPMKARVGSVSPVLFKDGEGCGACYKVKCLDHGICSRRAVTVIVTDECPGGMCGGGRTHFDLSGAAFSRMAVAGAGSRLRDRGQLSVVFRRTACKYGGKSIAFRVNEGSTNFWLSLLVEFEDGEGDLGSMQIKQPCPPRHVRRAECRHFLHPSSSLIASQSSFPDVSSARHRPLPTRRVQLITVALTSFPSVASEVFGVSRGGKQEAKDTWWWNDEVQRAIKEKKECFKRLHLDKSATNIEGYKIAKRAAKRAVSVAKGQTYDNLYQRLSTKEGEKDIYRMARIREQKTRDINQIKCIKDGETEIEEALKRMKSGKAMGHDSIPIEANSVEWLDMKHVWGATWCLVRGPLVGPFSVRLTTLSGRKTLTARDVIPKNWRPKATYTSRLNFDVSL